MPNEIQLYGYVEQPFDRVCDELRSRATSVFHEATAGAVTRAAQVAAGLHVRLAGVEISRDVQVRVKSYVEYESRADRRMTVELEWQSADLPSLYPVMQASLHVYPVCDTETQLDFHGNYEPPLGVLGKAVNAVIGHRIAEASVHQFMQDVTSYLNKKLSKPHSIPGVIPDNSPSGARYDNGNLTS